jgi:hypothetical protein
VDHVDHYAESFSVGPDQCFRMVISADSGSQGAPTHCPNHVEIAGRFEDAKGLGLPERGPNEGHHLGGQP